MTVAVVAARIGAAGTVLGVIQARAPGAKHAAAPACRADQQAAHAVLDPAGGGAAREQAAALASRRPGRHVRAVLEQPAGTGSGSARRLTAAPPRHGAGDDLE